MKSTEKKSLISVNMEEDIQNYSPTGFFLWDTLQQQTKAFYILFSENFQTRVI